MTEKRPISFFHGKTIDGKGYKPQDERLKNLDKTYNEFTESLLELG